MVRPNIPHRITIPAEMGMDIISILNKDILVIHLMRSSTRRIRIKGEIHLIGRVCHLLRIGIGTDSKDGNNAGMGIGAIDYV
jgi:hypothetical protein